MALRQDIRITAASNVVVSAAMCKTTSGSLSMIAYPVFSQAVAGAGFAYQPDAPLVNITAGNATVASNSPSFSGSLSAGGFTATLTYGVTFSQTPQAWYGGTPDRYRYIVYSPSALSPPTQWNANLASHNAVVMQGAINISVGPTVASSVRVCGVTVQ